MLEDASPHSWSRADDEAVVQSMLSNSLSRYWQECFNLVRTCVRRMAEGIPEDNWEDIAQEVMMRVYKYLPSFKFESSVKTWITTIVDSCIVNFHRGSKHTKYHVPLPNGMYQEDGSEDAPTLTYVETPEKIAQIREQLREVTNAIDDYIVTHAKPARNRRILEMALLENISYEEIAKAVGCNAPVVGYIVRSARRYLREKQ